MEAELMPWEEAAQSPPQELMPWEEAAAAAPITPAEEPDSGLESAVRGAAQGATFGFAPDISAAVESTLGTLGIVDDKSFRQAKEESERAFAKAEKEHPGVFTAGEIAGAVAGLVAGGAAAKGAVAAGTSLAKSATLAKAFKVAKTLANPSAEAIAAASAKTGVPPAVLRVVHKAIKTVLPDARNAVSTAAGFAVVKKLFD
jgi:hypothetical protein